METQQQLSPIWKPYAEAARDLGFRLTQSALGPGRSSSGMDDLARRLHREFERMAKEAFASLPGSGAACGPGCDHCCRTLRVTASPVEIFSISRRLRQSHDLDRALQQRLSQLADEGTLAADPARSPGAERALTWRGLAPCPQQADGLCVVYSSRPLACRGCVSADASMCAAAGDDGLVPGSIAHQLGAAAITKGSRTP